jgi:hypothetical protein
MPQASEELRAKMEVYFGDPIDDGGPRRHLLANGYKEVGGSWVRPDRYSNLSDIPQKDWDCLVFLVHEWDYEVRE